MRCMRTPYQIPIERPSRGTCWPEYPTVRTLLRATSCWILRLMLWAYGVLKSWTTEYASLGGYPVGMGP